MGNHTIISVLFFGLIFTFSNSSNAGACSSVMTYAGYVEQNGQCVKPTTGQASSEQLRAPYRDLESQRRGEAAARNAASTTAAPVNKFKGRDCNSMQVPFNSLKYVEQRLSDRLASSGGTCEVVPGYSDGDAAATGFCQGGYLINPGNPQYRKENAGVAGNSLSTNKMGYYFCIRSTTSFNKQIMCTEMANSDLCRRYSINIRFEPKSRDGKDGNCMCGAAGSLHQEECSQKDLSQIASNDPGCDEKLGLIKNTDESSIKTKGLCLCDTSKGFKDNGNGTCTPPEQAATASGDISPALISCVQGFEKRAAECESSANKAKTTCNQKDAENPEVNDALGATDILSEMFQKKNQGTGMVNECVKAAAFAKSPKIILNALKEKCDTNFEECSKLCTDDDVQKYTQQCGDIANNLAQEEVKTKGVTPNNNKNVAYFRERLAVIKNGQEAGAKSCKEDASSSRSIFGDVLSGLGESFMKGQRCACQASSTALGTGQSSCDSLPTAEQCAASPGLAGCPSVVSIDICSPGSQNYSYLGCKCQQDPRAEGCSQYVADKKGVSGFAGTDVGSGSGGSGVSFNSGGGSGSNLSGSDLNLGSNTASEIASANKSGAAAAGQGGPMGAGGAGGFGGAPGGGPEGTAGTGGDGAESSSGGAFGFIKSMASGLLGGSGSGNKKNEQNKGGLLGQKFDPNKYRPNRSVAQEYGVGLKNSELWQLMHDGYEVNQTTFIPNP